MSYVKNEQGFCLVVISVRSGGLEAIRNYHLTKDSLPHVPNAGICFWQLISFNFFLASSSRRAFLLTITFCFAGITPLCAPFQ